MHSISENTTGKLPGNTYIIHTHYPRNYWGTFPSNFHGMLLQVLRTFQMLTLQTKSCMIHMLVYTSWHRQSKVIWRLYYHRINACDNVTSQQKPLLPGLQTGYFICVWTLYWLNDLPGDTEWYQRTIVWMILVPVSVRTIPMYNISNVAI